VRERCTEVVAEPRSGDALARREVGLRKRLRKRFGKRHFFGLL
jgi:hypothetical protein